MTIRNGYGEESARNPQKRIHADGQGPLLVQDRNDYVYTAEA